MASLNQPSGEGSADNTAEELLGPYRDRAEQMLTGFEQTVAALEQGRIRPDTSDEKILDYLKGLEGQAGGFPHHSISGQLTEMSRALPDDYDRLTAKHDDLKARLRVVKPNIWETLYGSSQ